MPSQDSKPQRFFENWISVLGKILSVVWFVAFVFLFFLDSTAGGQNPYLGVFSYFVIPAFLFFSLLLIPLGAWWERKRRLKGKAVRRFPTIDFNNPAHQRLAYTFWAVTTLFVMFIIVVTYRGYEFTESTEFCGLTCHQVMHPEFTTYQNSPHARVKCVECHIGPGAEWYVRSKLSGLRQVYHTIKKDYSSPIPTPVHNLRPSKETCEQCHWPGKFYSSFEIRRSYFSSEDNSKEPWFIRMLVHIGRSDKPDYGIHAHMYLDNTVSYVADDEQRQKISWVKSTGKDGKEVIYTSPDSKYKNTPPPPEKIRQMDCIDCHNRPSHQFAAPYNLVNRAIEAGQIAQGIPNIKQKAMDVLAKNYKTETEGLAGIRHGLEDYYRSKQAEYYQAHTDEINQAIDAVVAIYERNFFPERKARWDIYPDNIGHLVSPGCFRCHDGEHKAKDGRAITRDCTVCHNIIEQGPASNLEKSTDGLPFKHPFNEDESWKEMNCFDCHTGS